MTLCIPLSPWPGYGRMPPCVDQGTHCSVIILSFLNPGVCYAHLYGPIQGKQWWPVLSSRPLPLARQCYLGTEDCLVMSHISELRISCISRWALEALLANTGTGTWA